ncbi:MAG: GntR family transcriptional regulator [Chloroflexi bacterium]|nr:GntR family transcriptional regulator [Chloroflexota bacterium]
MLTGLTGLAVRPRLLSEEIYSTLRNAIIEERLPPGMKIVEERLASELGVSRIPLREALHKLERDGFVESLAHRGFRVTSFTESDLQQIYEIREFLEVPAAVKAIPKLRQHGFGPVEEALAAMRESVMTGEPIKIVSQHVRFHRLIYEASDNPRLVELLTPFMELGFTYRVARRAGANGWDDFLNAHQRLIDVLRTGTPEEVAQEMVEHLQLGKRTSLSVLTAEGTSNRRV